MPVTIAIYGEAPEVNVLSQEVPDIVVTSATAPGPQGAAGAAGAAGVVQSLTAGSGITIDSSNPAAPVITNSSPASASVTKAFVISMSVAL